MLTGTQLIAALTDHQLLIPGDYARAMNVEISPENFITKWSDAKAGSVVLLYKGVSFDPHQKLGEIIARNPALIIVEDLSLLPPTAIPVIAVNSGRAAWSVIASALAGQPQDRLRMVGVTGTNGKTSTVWFLRQILRRMGKRVATVGTLGAFIEDEQLPTQHTTPDPNELYPLFKLAADQGCEYLIMEASSHAIAQEKLRPLQFDVAVFTSFSQDHLDLHGTMEEYFATKKRLFTNLSKNNAFKLVHATLKDRNIPEVRYYGLDTDINITRQTVTKTEFTLVNDASPLHYSTGIIGSYFIENLSAAIMTAHSLTGLWPDKDHIAQLLPVPGRLEKVSGPEAGPYVFVDYAHTPDAIAATVQELKTLSPAPLHIVFGCGGDRDQGKRPKMYAAAESADFIYVTSDNPRTEDPERIIDQILHGANASALRRTVREPSRELAIARCIQQAQKGDVILIAGKGHEDYQIIGHEKLPFDDCQVAQKYLAQL